jgi:putative ABC transport system permease protein
MYRFLLLLLPRHRRHAYGDEMRDVFNAAMHASTAKGGRRATARLWVREVAGMVRFAMRDRLMPGPGRGWFSGSELHWALRSLRSRGWAAASAVGLLAMAIAANGIVFSAVDSLAINTTPYPNVDRIVSIVNSAQEGRPLSRTSARDLIEQGQMFERIAGYAQSTLFIQADELSERVGVINATPQLLPVLGISPRWGRLFSTEDVRIHDSDVVVISESLARKRFGTPEAAVGQTLDTTDVPLRIVGVMDSTFRFPNGMVEVWRGLDFDGPLASVQFSVNVVARLRSEQTASDVNGLLLGRGDPSAKTAFESQPFVKPMQDRTRFFALLGAALCLLLTACANAASLELVAAAGRARTYAIQRALGASRSLIARTILIEGAILIGVATLVGVGLAALGLDALVAELPRSYGVVPANPIDLDRRALWFMGAVAAVTWLLTALPVMVFATGVSLLDVIKHNGRSQSGSRFTSRLRQGLTGAQVALAVILLVGGLLYARTYLARISVDKGFDSTNLASLSLILPPQDIPRLAAIRTSVLERLSAHPGVVGITADSPPPSGNSPTRVDQIEIDGAPVPASGVAVASRQVSPGYLDLIGVRLREGRLFLPEEPAGQVVISESFAKRFWPNGAVGHSFRLDPQMPTNVIVGVVSHIRSNEDRFAEERGVTLAFYERAVPRTGPPRPAAPRPGAPQFPGRRIVSATSAFISMTMKLDSPARLPEIIEVIRRDVPQFAVSGAMINDTYKDWEAETRLQTSVITAFGILSFGTALVGLYGVMMFLVAGRTRELGIRMALGATNRDVMRLVLQSASRMSIGGAIVGLLGAVALSRFVEDQLFGVSAVDASTYALVVLIVIACATLATWLPARRAARVDPAITLRSE